MCNRFPTPVHTALHYKSGVARHSGSSTPTSRISGVCHVVKMTRAESNTDTELSKTGLRPEITVLTDWP